MDSALKILMEKAGMTKQQAQHEIDQLECVLVTGIPYDDIDDAYINGDITMERATELYVEYGHMYQRDAEEKVQELTMEKETGMKLSNLAEAYVNGEVSETDAVEWLQTYGGYTESESTEKAAQWSLAISHGITYGSADNGIKKALIEGYISEETAKNLLMDFGGHSEEAAEDYIQQYLFTKETGYNFSEIDEAWKEGVINDEQYVDWMMKASLYTHGSAEIAMEYLEVAEWKANVPGAERMNRTGLEKWEARESSLAAQGLGREDFAKVWDIYSTSEAEYDSVGNQVKEKAEVVMERLGKLEGYNGNQLTQLGYSVYSARKVNAYKTW